MPLPSNTRTHDNEQEQKRIKKRAQNRLSQRCIREKQVLRIQQLERRLNLLEGQGDCSAAGVNAKLLKENEELRDVLQLMRKKLLSIASTATAVADKVVFQDGPTQPHTPSDSCKVDQEPLEQEDPTTGTRIHIVENSTVIDSGQMFHSSTNNSAASTLNEIDVSIFNNTDFDDIQWEHWLLGNITSTSSSLMIELENLVKEISSKVTLSNLYPLLLARNPNIVKAAPIQDSTEIDNRTLNNLVELAVRLMVNLSPWGAAVILMDYIKHIEYVIQWRINPTPANEALIPAHLRPTDLQKRSPERHPYIDHVFWPALRDQLILTQDKYDMPTLIPELIRQTVRQDQECFAAYPVLEFQARIKYPNAPRSVSLDDLLLLPTQTMASHDPKQRMLLFREIKKYGLDRLEDWRISPEFFGKYPDLSTPSLVCELPIIDFDTAHLYFQSTRLEGDRSEFT